MAGSPVALNQPIQIQDENDDEDDGRNQISTGTLTDASRGFRPIPQSQESPRPSAKCLVASAHQFSL